MRRKLGDDLELVIGTKTQQYYNEVELTKMMANEISKEIDKTIVEELNRELHKYQTKWDQKRIIEITEQKNYQKSLDYNSLEKYMDDYTKYYFKRNLKNG